MPAEPVLFISAQHMNIPGTRPHPLSRALSSRARMLSLSLRATRASSRVCVFVRVPVHACVREAAYASEQRARSCERGLLPLYYHLLHPRVG